MTDPREALSRLTRWRDKGAPGLVGAGTHLFVADVSALLSLVEKQQEALNHAEAFITAAPHGDNCFLHDEGEFSTCRCGKDGALEAVTATLSTTTGEHG